MCACTCAHALSVSPLLKHAPGVHTHINVGIIQVLGMAAELLEAPGACEDPQNLEHSVYTWTTRGVFVYVQDTQTLQNGHKEAGGDRAGQVRTA